MSVFAPSSRSRASVHDLPAASELRCQFLIKIGIKRQPIPPDLSGGPRPHLHTCQLLQTRQPSPGQRQLFLQRQRQESVAAQRLMDAVYGVFDVDTSESENAFSTNEKFRRNSMLAFLVQSASEQLEHLLDEPEGYSQEAVSAALTAEPVSGSAAQQPNVLVIMSESFADFRRLNGTEGLVDPASYADFDAVAAESNVLNVAVPTFASYTVRTEFELMYGLPVRSLMDTITPQRSITVGQPSSMVSYYNDCGYNTCKSSGDMRRN